MIFILFYLFVFFFKSITFGREPGKSQYCKSIKFKGLYHEKKWKQDLPKKPSVRQRRENQKTHRKPTEAWSENQMLISAGLRIKPRTHWCKARKICYAYLLIYIGSLNQKYCLQGSILKKVTIILELFWRKTNLIRLKKNVVAQGEEKKPCFTGGQTSQVGSVGPFFFSFFLNSGAKITLKTQKFL